jgi:3-hydroxyacyl-[acyl-carrier-protein] dehydratase
VKETGRFVIAPRDACVDGHFPGMPIVPGVVLLDEVVTLARAGGVLAGVAEIEVSKFTDAVFPGQEVVVSCAEPDAGRVAFACTVAGRRVALGVLRCADPNL